jgi:DNA-binding transcriptional ArsR family regulator
MDPLVLENKRLKAISSESRLKILKILSCHRETLSDIAKKMDMQKSTIKGHLELLEDSGLIKQIESKNIWKYYELTNDGKSLVNPYGVKILIALGISTLIAFVFALKLFWTQFGTSTANQVMTNISSDLVSVTSTDMVTSVNNTVVKSVAHAASNVNAHLIYAWILFFVFILISIGLLIFYFYKKRKIGR